MTGGERELDSEKTGNGPFVLSLAIGGMVAVGVFFALQRWEYGVVRAAFEAVAVEGARAVERRAQLHIEALDTGGTAYRLAGGFGRSGFADYASGLLNRHPDRVLVLWLPRVTDKARETFEQAARGVGATDYHIVELDGAGKPSTVSARRRDEYFPIRYGLPESGARDLLGIDLAAEARFRNVLHAAGRAASVRVSGSIPFAGPRSGQPRVGLFRPVYDISPAELLSSERPARLRGFVLLIIDMAALIDKAAAGTSAADTGISVVDRGVPDGDRVLYRRPTPSFAPEMESPWRSLLVPHGLEAERTIIVGGREWKLSLTPGRSFLSSHMQWRAPAAAAAVFALAVLVAWRVHGAVRRPGGARLAGYPGEQPDGRSAGDGETDELHARLAEPESAARHDRDERHVRTLAAALHQSSDTVILTDAGGTIRYVNAAFERVTGFSRREAVGSKPNILKSDRHDVEFYARLWDTLRSGLSFRDVFVNRKKDGTLYYEEKTITPLKNAGGCVTGFVSIGKEITQRMQDQERLQHLAYHDLLTGLPNRALFMDRLMHALLKRRKTGTRLAVLFLDTDEFKHINDTLGHAVGDRVLQLLAERVTSCVREGDTVARIGGDEFAVLLEEVGSPDDVSVIAQKILDALGRPLRVDEHDLLVTISIGISLFPDDGEAADTLLSHADDAMYRAKQEGRASYQFYSSTLEHRTLARLTYESELHRAIERDEFTIYYQPQVDLRSGRAVGVGVEALIRWQHPDAGLIGPDDFIPKLESMEQPGLITLIGEWVLRSACRQVAAWQREGADPFRLSVNISGRQFHQRELHRIVASVLRETGFDPYHLELEITERALMRHDRASRDNLQALQDLGVRLAIDDFGVGYSSLSSLKSLPVDTLKIDRMFIGDLTGKRNDAGIVSAIIAMGRHMGLEVVAEGVETHAQMEFLKRHGCYVMQGFLFSRPLPEYELSRLIA